MSTRNSLAAFPIAASLLMTAATAQPNQNTSPALTGHGAAVLSVMAGADNIQSSNFGGNSFRITNTGHKTITQVTIDVTGALYPDTVFDPEGLAGDSIAKPLHLDTRGGTGVVDPEGPDATRYVGPGGAKGYERLVLVFDPDIDRGFNPGERLGFSIDMDPNSIAGTNKGPVDAGTVPHWDAGGVSGAELIASRFTVTFADGTSATGQLHGTDTQAGAHGRAAQNSPNLKAQLRVNDLEPGGVGTYSTDGPRMTVQGPAGRTARVVLTKGFIQPVTAYNEKLHEQLKTLAASDFPANNAVEFQTVDVTLTGKPQDVTAKFRFSGVPGPAFATHPERPFSVDTDKLPIGVVAAIIDPENDALPLGPVTDPIYLTFE